MNSSTCISESRRPHAAFTLIELLVVISIIGLLVGLLLPALSAARETAKTSACLSQLKQMGIATYGYSNDYDAELPPSFYYDSGPPVQHNDFSVLLANYMGVSGKDKSQQNNSKDSRVRDVFICPEALPATNSNTRLMTYSAHPRIFINPIRVNNPGNAWMRLPKRVRVGDMLRASEIIMVFDGAQREADGNDVGYGAEATNIDGKRFTSFSLLLRSTAYGRNDANVVDPGPNVDVPNPNTFADEANANIRGRHNENTIGTFVFGDGHAASVPFSADGTDLQQRNICADK